MSGFWTIYLNKIAQKPRKIWTIMSGLFKKLLKNAQGLNDYERFI